MNELRMVQAVVHDNAVEKGWWETEVPTSQALMLMVSELAEACEADRVGNPPSEKIPKFSSVEEELADTVIRILDFAGGRGFDLVGAMKAKHQFNTTREHKHGGKEY